jgi:hypothetical protein
VTGKLTITKTFDTNTGSRASPGSAFGANPVQYNGKTLSNSYFDAVDESCGLLQTAFCSTPFTLKLQFGFGTINNTPTGSLGISGDGAGTFPMDFVPDFKNRLIGKAVTVQALAFANALPGSNPFSTFPLACSPGWCEWMGLPPFSNGYPNPHGFIGIGSGFNYTWSHNDTFQGSTFDAVGVLLHEETEMMCRFASPSPNSSPAPKQGNYVCFSSAGVYATSQTGSQYVSLDGGVTNLYATNCQGSGDMLDLQGTAYVPSGGGANFQQWEARTKQQMDCLGWQWSGL